MTKMREEWEHFIQAFQAVPCRRRQCSLNLFGLAEIRFPDGEVATYQFQSIEAPSKAVFLFAQITGNILKLTQMENSVPA